MLPFEIDRQEDGQGLLEYALILGLVSIAAVGALVVLGGDAVGMYDFIWDEVSAAFGL